jgi:hypothetical protein
MQRQSRAVRPHEGHVRVPRRASSARLRVPARIMR